MSEINIIVNDRELCIYKKTSDETQMIVHMTSQVPTKREHSKVADRFERLTAIARVEWYKKCGDKIKQILSKEGD